MSSLVALTSAMFMGWWWLWVPLAFLVTYVSYGIFAIIVALLVDGYFGAWTGIPYVTFSVIAIVFLVGALRPYLYNSSTV